VLGAKSDIYSCFVVGVSGVDGGRDQHRVGLRTGLDIYHKRDWWTGMAAEDS